MERCSHRDHRVILRYSRRILSLLLSLPRSVFSPFSRVWVANVRPAVVLFYDLALLVLLLICSPPLCLIPDNGARQRHLYLIVSTHPSLWISSRLRFPIISTPSLCVRPLSSSLALAPIVCAYYLLLLTPFVVCIFFYPSFLLLFCLYSSLTVVLP